MTEWERTGETKYRDKIIAGMDSIAAMPYRISHRAESALRLRSGDRARCSAGRGWVGVYNLATIMGGGEVVFELNDADRSRRLEESVGAVLLADARSQRSGGARQYFRQ